MRDSAEGPKDEDEKPAAAAAEQTAAPQEAAGQDVRPELVMPTHPCEPPAEPDEKREATNCETHDLEEEEEDEEEDDDEEELEEEGEDEADTPNDSSVKEPEIRCDEKLEDLLEEPKNVPEEALEDSVDTAPVVTTPTTKEEANGDVCETLMFPCQHCERKFTTKQGLERHVHIHMPTVNHAFKCKYCGKAFGTQINRRRHERRHEAGLKRKPSLALPSPEDPADGPVSGDSTAPKADSSPPSLGQDCLVLNSEKASQEAVNSVVEENGEVKELHPCKYCKKVFGTHTNMRRHQRRVHERHLIPKGVRRKGGLEEPQPPAEQAQPAQNAYVPSTEPEEEGEADDVYIMDISSNISENLNYYIDGKIQPSSSTSNCDVIEMEASSADLYGINCLLAPVTVAITQNLKAPQVPTADDPPKEPSSSTNPESKKRRTASPPALPQIKAEAESDPAGAPSCSLSLPLSISALEVVSVHKEKSVHLSSKLKQLLQTQDKLTPPAGISATEVPKLGPVCVSAPASMLPVTSSRFKRRTSSPPSSPQHSPALRDFGKQSDGKAVWTDAALNSKKPKLESHSSSPVWSLSGREDSRETVSPPCFDDFKVSKEWAGGPTFSNVCNQQPLDLSSGVKQKAEGTGKTPAQWESALDLSVHRKPGGDSEGKEVKENHLMQPACSAVKKKKPTTCMLQKVLLNEYNGIDLPAENSPDVPRSPSPCKSPGPQPDPERGPDSGLPAAAVESPPDASPSSPTLQTPSLPSGQLPPLLTPTNPSSPPPCPPVLTVATPPPPLLPTVPPPAPSSSASPRPCPSPLSNAAAPSPLPILSPTVSPSPSPIPSVEPLASAGSPGPPTLSSSSSSSSSFSPSSSSSSPSPPPLSAVSSVVSSGDNLEASLPVIAFKQEDLESEDLKPREEGQAVIEQDLGQETFNKNFVCNVCESPFLSIKDLTKHLSVHAEEWPFKCEFCVQLFKAKTALSEHRFLLHGVGNIFVCSVCKKEFAFLCNLQQHQRDLHPDKVCTHHEFESGTLRPQNFTDPSKAHAEHAQSLPGEPLETSKEEEELNDSSEELYTTIKIMASGVKTKDPDVRLGLNQHYPSFKPPPFQYHHRNPMGIGVTATNFTTHNIPQTFTTAIRCTKCGKGVDNMPELHKHILACASASDKKRYTPKKNPVPLKQTVQPRNGVVVLETAGKNAFRRMGQPKRLNFSVELSKMSSNKLKLNALKKKNQLVQKAILQKNKAARQKADFRAAAAASHVCPYCSREFTYIGSLNKHAAFSCPKKPLSPSKKKGSHSSKKGGHASPASADRNGSGGSSSSSRRRTADAEIKMQSTQAPLGKTRARSSGPAPAPLPTSAFRSKQNVKFAASVKAKKPSSSLRNSSPIRMAKITHVEGKKPKAVAKNHSAQLSNKTSRSLHVRVQKSKAVLQSKSALASKKRTDRFNVKSRERSGGPITRSLQLAAAADPGESRREDGGGRQELKDFRNFL
ncbi:PREDICTED: PR domain zinc finger protein 2 isoform X1 [Condylura cristata]|uniref:PR domain zinc finger protein 2 isoform X1 n=1 Tax=Condylura cristata TaxID=143302 RepID=UPI0006431966|nr:PREDICTED: PR domain zinc finger protein 2 isoform X1 [Condylura cristata]